MEVEKWVPPILGSFHLGWFSTSMIMGERVFTIFFMIFFTVSFQRTRNTVHTKCHQATDSNSKHGKLLKRRSEVIPRQTPISTANKVKGSLVFKASNSSVQEVTLWWPDRSAQEFGDFGEFGELLPCRVCNKCSKTYPRWYPGKTWHLVNLPHFFVQTIFAPQQLTGCQRKKRRKKSRYSRHSISHKNAHDTHVHNRYNRILLKNNNGSINGRFLKICLTWMLQEVRINGYYMGYKL